MDIMYEWSSILDDNTCEDCEALDGEIFASDEVPDFPQHAGCRCDLIPDIGDYYD